MGARAAALLGLPSAIAIASTIVDLTLEMLAQLGYTALGLSILSAQKPNNHLIAWAALGIVLAFLAAIGFILVQRHGFTVIESMFGRVPYYWAKALAARLAPIQRAIHDIYRRRSALWSAGFLHFAIWVASSVEAWIALRLMGAKLGIGSVIAIESLLYAVRSTAFFVPNAFGVQEGAYVLLGVWFGFRSERRSRLVAPQARAGPCHRRSSAAHLADTREPSPGGRTNSRSSKCAPDWAILGEKEVPT